MLDTIWYSSANINTRGVSESEELSAKDRRDNNETVSMGVLLRHKCKLCLIEGPSMLTRSSITRRNLGTKDSGKAYDQPDQVMVIMKNYVTRPSEHPF